MRGIHIPGTQPDVTPNISYVERAMLTGPQAATREELEEFLQMPIPSARWGWDVGEDTVSAIVQDFGDQRTAHITGPDDLLQELIDHINAWVLEQTMLEQTMRGRLQAG